VRKILNEMAKTLALIATIVLVGIAIEIVSNLFWKAARYPYDLKGEAQVIDADTLFLDGRDVRLLGIDAPEVNQTCDRSGQAWPAGRAATKWLNAQLQGSTVGCNFTTHDKYIRIVATCYINGTDLNARIVSAGWAYADRRYSKRYIPEETAAKQAKKGIWIGNCAPPWEYRRKR